VPEHLIGIVDYGMGNLASVSNALLSLELPVRLLRTPARMGECSHLILPGVGAFEGAMTNLKAGGWIAPLNTAVLEAKCPVLGICLGMQLLATTSTEFGLHEGLNWVPGTVEKIRPASDEYLIPHIGWNDVKQVNTGTLYDGIADHGDFYFVHSYHFLPTDPADTTGVADHGGEVTASIERGHIVAAQFHPEKSGPAGLRFLRNFSRMV
jgi:imidazole glycerol-phosphate synthase subunit HisH